MGQGDLLEKGMATHSSILAWRIPWTEEPGGATVHGLTESDRTEGLTLSLAYHGAGSLVLDQYVSIS